MRDQTAHRIDEHDPVVLGRAPALCHEQVPYLVLGIREHERHGREPVTFAQAGREALEQRIQTVRLEQFHLATLRPLPGFLVLASLVRERRNSTPELDEFAVVLVHVSLPPLQVPSAWSPNAIEHDVDRFIFSRLATIAITYSRRQQIH